VEGETPIDRKRNLGRNGTLIPTNLSLDSLPRTQMASKEDQSDTKKLSLEGRNTRQSLGGTFVNKLANILLTENQRWTRYFRPGAFCKGSMTLMAMVFPMVPEGWNLKQIGSTAWQ
jgi:hypothetical protein